MTEPWPAELIGRPLLVAESRALEMKAAWLRADAERGAPRTPARSPVRAGVAIIPISGALMGRGHHFGDGSAITSYGPLHAAIKSATTDPNVKGIVLTVDSFGGEINGLLPVVAAVRDARAVKPVKAVVGSMAASAAYWLAAQADEIVLSTDISEVGSIGVYTMHVDNSRMLGQMGLDLSLIHAGE